MTRRAGMSLTEVLVALFILTLGVIGILTMFPLGAAQMAMAVRDDRSAQAAAAADGYMRWYWQNYVVPNPTANSKTLMANANGTLDPFFQPPPNGPSQSYPNNAPNLGGLFDNPAQLGTAYNAPQLNSLPALGNLGVNAQQINYTAGLMSYPVVVDPMGFLVRSATFGDQATPTLIPRWTLTSLFPLNSGNHQLVYKSCSLIDSLGYNDNGTPNGDLEMRYNWMWVLQRPQFVNEVNTPNNSNTSGLNIGVNGVINGVNVFNSYSQPLNLYTANMTVVVFDRRALLYPPSAVSGFEVAIPATFTSGLTSVTLNLKEADQALDLKPGSWVMDATINPNATPFPIRQAYFYRVVSLTQVSATQVNVELQSPVTPPTGYAPIGFNYPGTLVALKGVAGVFVRPPLTWY